MKETWADKLDGEGGEQVWMCGYSMVGGFECRQTMGRKSSCTIREAWLLLQPWRESLFAAPID